MNFSFKNNGLIFMTITGFWNKLWEIIIVKNWVRIREEICKDIVINCWWYKWFIKVFIISNKNSIFFSLFLYIFFLKPDKILFPDNVFEKNILSLALHSKKCILVRNMIFWWVKLAPSTLTKLIDDIKQ